MATSRLPLSAVSACSAAPVPRPPQPTRPIRMVSDPAACAFGRMLTLASVEAAATEAVDSFTNVRRFRLVSRIGSLPGKDRGFHPSGGYALIVPGGPTTGNGFTATRVGARVTPPA